MAGLLDFAMYDDPESVGRLAFGAGLLNAGGPQTRPISVGQALSQGLMGAQRASTEAAMNQRRNRLTDSQLHNADLDRQFKLFQMEQARRMANQPPSSRFERVGDSLVKIGPDESVTPVFQGQRQGADSSPIGRLIAEMNSLPPGDPLRNVYQAAINKASTHQPPIANISYGQPIPAINPQTGQPEFVRPDNRGGMAFTGVRPPPQNRDVKQPAEIQRMNIAATTMETLLNDYEKMVRSYSPRDPMVQGNPALRADMQALLKNMQLQFKELQALGALTGPDVAIMEAAITDPFTMKGAFYGKDGLLNQVGRARQLILARKDAIAKNTAEQGSQETPAAGASKVIRYDAQGNRIN